MHLQVFDRPPSALRYMTLAFWPSPGLRPGAPFPSIVMCWRGYRATAGEVDRFCVLSGVPAGEDLPFLFPHVIGFRLQMALLTHPAFPVPIWRVLQIRNRLRQHRTIRRDAMLDFEAGICGHRVLEKGLEVEVHCAVKQAGELAWECTNTFYARGRFGTPDSASPISSAPDVDGNETARWRTTRDGALRFGELTGDYNGIHLWDPYAKLFGFKRAFLHPQRVLAQCVARLSAMPSARPRRLDAWLKGPVPYGAQAVLRASRTAAGELLFALTTDQDERPAIIGRLTCAA